MKTHPLFCNNSAPTPLTALLATLLTVMGTVRATINIPLTGYSNDFSSPPQAGDWITSNSNIAGTDTTFTTVANVDTAIITNNYNATGLSTAVATGATNPITGHVLARHNTDLRAVQIRPSGTTQKAASILMARMNNATGQTVPGMQVSYDFAVAVPGTEEIPGWNAYYSVTGNNGWIKIPEFSVATSGHLVANLNLGGAGWAAGANLYVLWVDDNAAAVDDAAYTMDNFNVTLPCKLTAAISNVQRHLGANLTDPADDFFSFDATITAFNPPAGSAGWTTTGPNALIPTSGSYGQLISLTNIPLTALPATVGIADQADASCNTTLAATAAALPKYWALNTLTSPPEFVLEDASSAGQWAGDGILLRVVQNSGGGVTPYVAKTTPITLIPESTKYVSLTLEVEDRSVGSNLETDDILKIELVTDVSSRLLTGVIDKNHNGYINGNSTSVEVPYNTKPFLDEFNRGGVPTGDTFINRWQLHGVIPAEATTAQVIITGLNNSGTEFFRIQNVVFGLAVDSDGDGRYDSEEAIEGTSASDSTSLFRLSSQECNGGTYSLTVPSVSTRRYVLDTSADLLIWTPQSAPVPGTNGPLTLSTLCDPTRKFARITVH